MLYLPQTTLALEAMSLEALELSPIIAEVHSGEQPGDSTTARVEILLKQDSSYEATREGNDVVVSFVRPAAAEAPAVASQTANAPSSQTVDKALNGPPATMMTDITAQRLENGIEIQIRADGPIKDYASFTLRDPDRIVYDLYGVGSPYKKEQTIVVNTQWVAQVRHYGDGEKLRVVLDSDADNFEATTAMPIQDGLLIHVGQVARQAEAMATPAAASSVAWVNRIDFSAEPSGKSVVIVGTTSPVDYDLQKINDRRLELKLAKAQIPGFRRRPLVTTRFESAVDRVIPVQSERLKDTGLITIELRETVPYTVEKVENLIMVHFDASSVPPKPENRTDLPGWQQVVADAVSRESTGSTGPADSAAAGAESAAFSMSPSKTYTGEKIALDCLVRAHR